jgi:hypothetical protein
MGIVETINEKKRLSVGVAAGAIILAVLAIVWELNSNRLPGRMMKDFYSCDDGASYFVDDIDRIPPFDRDGKQAYRVHVFKCSGNVPFVGYIERYTDRARAELVKLQANPPERVAQLSADIAAGGTEVKKPGQTKWYSINSSDGADIIQPKCPDGGPVEGVLPE